MQINRLFEITYILLCKETVTAKELAEYFEVSSRTIYRDVEHLSAAGIPVYMCKGKGGGISLLPEFILDKAVLTDAEKEDILSSLKALGSVGFSETDSALKKLSSLFGGAKTDWIEVDFTSWVNGEEEKTVFNILKSAILSKNIITFTYASGRGENTQRKIEPLKLCYKKRGWYLFGFCETRSDYRFFKLTRIKDLCVYDLAFKRNSPAKIFTGNDVFEGDSISLKLKLSSNMAFRVYDEFSDFEQLEDGSFIVETIYPKNEWIFSYVASFGEFCEVLAPEEVRLEMKKILENTIKKYL